MKALDFEWLEEFRSQLIKKPSLAELLGQLAALERKYNEIVDTLEPEQQEILQEFYSANQILQIYLAQEFYQRGLQEHAKSARGPAEIRRFLGGKT